MTRQISERIVAVLLVLFLLAYVGYQAYRYFDSPLSTETIYEHTVSRGISTRGIAVRSETPIARAATGAYYPLDDATRVAIGETVAELRQGGYTGGGNTGVRARQLEEELRLLREAQTVPVEYANTDIYNRDLKTGVSQLSAMAGEGRFSGLAALRTDMTLNINKRQISNGKADNFAERISELESQLRQVAQTAPAGGETAVRAERTGFFSSVTDGYETRITPESLKDMTIEQCVGLIESEPISAPGQLGKLVTNEKWTFMVTVPRYTLEWINELVAAKERVGQKLRVELALDQVSQKLPATVDRVIDDLKSDQAVLLLGCDRMSEDLINIRFSDVEISFERYTGLRINASDLRFRTRADGTTERGVYILRNNLVYFRLIDPVYEEAGFVLSRTYYSAEEYLEPQRQALRQQSEEAPEEEPEDLTLEQEEQADLEGVLPAKDQYKKYVILFDQVITKGKDLYDEKTVPVN